VNQIQCGSGVSPGHQIQKPAIGGPCRGETPLPQLSYREIFFCGCRQKLNPNVAKVGGLQSQGAQGRSRSKSTASPCQRRIWSPPAFPQGKKDGLKQAQSSSSPWVDSLQGASTRRRFNTHKALLTFCHLFYATLGLTLAMNHFHRELLKSDSAPWCIESKPEMDRNFQSYRYLLSMI